MEPYRYSGVFGPPSLGTDLPSPSGSGWGSPNKRGSRSGGLPMDWYQPPPVEPPTSPFESYRPSTSSPGLSPPASTSSGPTTSASSSHFPAYQLPNHYHHPSVAGQSMYPLALDPSFGGGGGGGAGLNNHAIDLGNGQSPPPFMFTMNGPGGNPYAQGGMQPYMSPPMSSGMPGAPQQRNGGAGAQTGLWRQTSYSASQPLDDDVIPTAIVIKNIPFSVHRDSLLEIIESLGAPLPYAFNYHHDNGVFRGLAFANFRVPEDAASVVAALNGFDVQGRKLRVEYKKVLQPGEKDRIEREKALKRMRSIQFNDHPANAQQQQAMRDSRDMPPPPVPPIHLPPSRNSDRSGEYGVADYSPPQSVSSRTSDTLPLTLDLNDPVALDIYSRVLVFKEDRMRDELAFSKSLASTERRVVHLVAQKLGLTSVNKHDGVSTYVVVTREATSSRPTLTTSLSGSVNYLSPFPASAGAGELQHQQQQQQQMSSAALRIKKSMPDLRGFHGAATGRDPARSLMAQRSSGNLREWRDSSGSGDAVGRRMNGHSYGSGSFNSLFGSSIGEAPPPVPPMPAGINASSYGRNGHSFGTSPDANDYQFGSGTNNSGAANGTGPHAPSLNNSSSNPSLLTRNPRGPAGESRGFGGPGTLRTSVSHGVMRGGSGFGAAVAPPSGGAGGFGRGRVTVDEDEAGELLALTTGMDSLRTKDSHDL